MKFKKYFTTKQITKGFFIAILLSAFIYIEHFRLLDGYFLYAFNSILFVLGLYFLLQSPTPVWFFSGFFIGIFWFWWMGVSFYYYDLSYLIVVVVLIIGLIMGLIFLFAAFFASFLARKIEAKFPFILYEDSIVFLRALALLIPITFELFGFNWFKLQVAFIDSFFGVELWQFMLIVFTVALFIEFKKWYILFLLLLVFDVNKPLIFTPKSLQDIELLSTNISTKEKWKRDKQEQYTTFALEKIDKAIKNGKKLIIFPESFLPYFLNLETPYLNKFLKRSKDITIIIGSLYYKGKNNFRNSAYIIQNGKYQIANKVVLVPFGEANPLPEFMSKIVNKIFFDGAVDYKADNNFTYIHALDKKYKIAICYEGTSKKTYEDKPEYLIVLSNDAWFYPSIEPTLQMLLMKYFAKLHNTTIYHSINKAPSYIIMPFEE